MSYSSTHHSKTGTKGGMAARRFKKRKSRERRVAKSEGHGAFGYNGASGNEGESIWEAFMNVGGKIANKVTGRGGKRQKTRQKTG
jgi:hypothetical protein